VGIFRDLRRSRDVLAPGTGSDARVDKNPRERGLGSFEEKDYLGVGDEYVTPLEPWIAGSEGRLLRDESADVLMRPSFDPENHDDPSQRTLLREHLRASRPSVVGAQDSNLTTIRLIRNSCAKYPGGKEHPK
jgi:hypothetical protein